MPKYRNKKSLRNINRDAMRRKALKNKKATKAEELSDKYIRIGCFVMFIIGILLSFFINSIFAILIFLPLALIGVNICNFTSKHLFGKSSSTIQSIVPNRTK